MRLIITKHLAAGYNSPVNINIPKIERRGVFSLYDSRTCSSNIQNGLGKCEQCEQKILNIEANSTVEIINWELVLSNFKRGQLSKGERCDYIVFDKSQLYFIELSCINQKYLDNYETSQGVRIGKVAKAKQQIVQTIEKLVRVNEIKTRIESFEKRIACFAFKAEDATIGNKNIVLKNMSAFMKLDQSINKAEYICDLPYGFSFIKIQYPTLLKL